MKTALLIGWILLMPAASMAAGGRDAGGGFVVTANAPATLEGGARSERALIDEFLLALRNQDGRALRRLRVTEAEYRDVIIPGTVPPDQPRRSLSATWTDYAWANLNDRSTVHEQRLLADYGGRALALEEVRFEDGVQEYAGYVAYRQLRLTVRDPGGTAREVRTGSIAEVAGEFKFISFIRD